MTVKSWTTFVVARHANCMRDTTQTELVVVAFVLHGPLVIGLGYVVVTRDIEGAGVCCMDGSRKGR
jgi:hypothetical protein